MLIKSFNEIPGKDVPGYEGLYRIDKEGNVYRLPKFVKVQRLHKLPSEVYLRTKKLKLSDCKGYRGVALTKNKKTTSFLVHRLVALTYLELPMELEVNHLNGNKADNRLCNLEVCTRKENVHHA